MQIDMMKNDRAKVFRPPPLHYNPPILPHPCFCQSSNLKKSKMHFEWAYHNTILFLFLGTRGLDGKQIPLLLLETLWVALLIGLGFGIPSKPPEIHPRCNSGALEHSNFQLGPCQRLLAPQVHLPPHFLFHQWAFNRACTLLLLTCTLVSWPMAKLGKRSNLCAATFSKRCTHPLSQVPMHSQQHE